MTLSNVGSQLINGIAQTVRGIEPVVPEGPFGCPEEQFLYDVFTAFHGAFGKLLPVISEFSPQSGPYGSQVTITGTNFINVSSVKIGNLSLPNYSVDSNTQITVFVEIPGQGGYELIAPGPITVVTSGGSVTTDDSFSLSNGLPHGGGGES